MKPLKKQWIWRRRRVSLSVDSFLKLPYLLSDSGIATASDYCTCKKCIIMDSKAENVCCKFKKFSISMPDGCCVTEHEDFGTIINKVDH